MGEIKECCRDLSNREPSQNLSKDLAVSACGKCGAKHYEMTVDPLELSITGKPLGA